MCFALMSEDLNSERLRSKFVQFQEKKTLVFDGNEKSIDDITKDGKKHLMNLLKKYEKMLEVL